MAQIFRQPSFLTYDAMIVKQILFLLLWAWMFAFLSGANAHGAGGGEVSSEVDEAVDVPPVAADGHSPADSPAPRRKRGRAKGSTWSEGQRAKIKVAKLERALTNQKNNLRNCSR